MMHQQPPSQQYNMPPGGGQHYQGQQPPMGMMGQVNQGNHMMGQRQMPPYRPPQQGPPQQFSGQEDYYGDQYSHGGQGPPEGMNQQYYPDGHSDYGYQQPSYPEQGYDRPYEDSSPHYYEGGNSQYGQQQDAYQGPPPQQGYPPQQQQYPGQQGYPGQQQGYGPSQGGPGPQYPNYPQGQGQQYGGYRAAQPGPPQPPQQRPYGYDQVRTVWKLPAVKMSLHSSHQSLLAAILSYFCTVDPVKAPSIPLPSFWENLWISGCLIPSSLCGLVCKGVGSYQIHLISHFYSRWQHWTENAST
ncbi:hypothetical protein U0070_026444 [Myodes glareolus]|uniref:Protein SSXT n=1 Tax=Myodes glareolus TaxID=447135 RepID=A0AAW0JIQ3_MYOGA